MKLRQTRLRPWLLVTLGSIAIAAALAFTHPADSIISFDEGFHGGAAIYLAKVIEAKLGYESFIPSPDYIRAEFNNGIVLYPPLWTFVATGLGMLFGLETAVFRFATSLFYIASIGLIFWFIRKVHSTQAAVLSSAILATIPMVMIYSHLMMLEIPLLLGVSFMVIMAYLFAFDLVPRNFWTITLTTVGFFFAPLTKLPALPVGWSVIAGFAIVSSIFFWRQKTFRRWLKPEFLLFMAASLLSIYAFIAFEEKYFHANMITFFVEQSQGTEQETNRIIKALQLAWDTRGFYLRDFYHIPLLTFIWFGATIVYAFWKRTPLALLFLCWAVIVYINFSGVLPQVPQYIMPIYVPLALATALLLYEGSLLLKTPNQSRRILLAASLIIIGLQIMALPKSEAYGWRANQTGQTSAARYIGDHAARGDRVISWHDGTIYAIREAGLDHYLQIRHGDGQLCPAAMRDSFEWAVVVNQPPYVSELDTTVLTQAPWKEIGRYGSKHDTILYKNGAALTPLTAEAEEFMTERAIVDPSASNNKALSIKDTYDQPSLWGCLRVLPFGQLTTQFWIKTVRIPAHVPDEADIIRIEYTAYPGGESGGKTLTAKELRSATRYTPFAFSLEHRQINLPGEFKVLVYREAEILLDKITVTPSSSLSSAAQ